MRILKSHPLLRLVNSYIIDSPQPSNISYLWNFGSLLGTCLIIQIITGVTLAMHYNPNVLEAFNSVEHIMRDVNNGWLIRYLHSNAASAFFFIVYLHIGRGLYYGSYKAPRTLVWSIGTVIFILMMATAFLGYVLPYGQMSLWGATVITNLMSAIPWVGQDIVEFIWGGFSVNNATLNRFFALHFVLPFVLAALALMHLIVLHDSAGSGNPLGVSGNSDRLPFAPYYIFKDLVTIFILIIALSVLVFFMPNALGDSENYVMANPMQTPPAIVPEWYLLPFYAILRSIPNKLLGVIAMFSAILVLLAMPFVDMSKLRGLQFRPLSRIAFFIFVGNFLILMILGAKHVESPYIELGQISTAIYFAHFFVVMPLVSTFENSLTDVFAKNSNKEIASPTLSNKINSDIKRVISLTSNNLINNNTLTNMKNNIISNTLSKSNFSTLKKSGSKSNSNVNKKNFENNKMYYYSIIILLLLIVFIINITIYFTNISLASIISLEIEKINNLFIINDIIEGCFGLISLFWLIITSLFTSHFDNSDCQDNEIIDNNIIEIDTLKKKNNHVYNSDSTSFTPMLLERTEDSYGYYNDVSSEYCNVSFTKSTNDNNSDNGNNTTDDTHNINTGNNTSNDNIMLVSYVVNNQPSSNNAQPNPIDNTQNTNESKLVSSPHDDSNKRKMNSSPEESGYDSELYIDNWDQYYENLDKKDNKRLKTLEYDERSIISSEIHDDDSEKTKMEKIRLKEQDDALKAEKVVLDAEMEEAKKIALEAEIEEESYLLDLETKQVLEAMEASKKEAIEASKKDLTETNKKYNQGDKEESVRGGISLFYNTQGPALGEAGPSNWYKNTSDSATKNDNSKDSESDPEFSTRNKGKKPDR